MSSGNILEIHVTKYNSVCMYTSVKNVIPKKSTKKNKLVTTSKNKYMYKQTYDMKNRREKRNILVTFYTGSRAKSFVTVRQNTLVFILFMFMS